ncbi:SusC/RagA family TonB-linked outer membrane protein [Niabella ginsengisoli]|uniref:SusC/RagA family TonB-linked outer membrane protein n=1 Tax=Niabella ginsengisoli TaxID=522298 RepID=A0ABS9SEA7_9BACT|nr:SusC/RagA family TonB-linked outer membrane protein [Niabella ginsengisoli]MCH5596680.1 SusC/RagA family TonB-linked outer membrane protein [Niabella ginsengisoli]
MRKILLLLAMSLLCSFLAFSQTQNISGQVVDETASPVSFATVTEKGTQNAVSADSDGKFTIKVSNSAILVVSSTGFAVVEVVASSAGTVVLKRGEGITIDEVVVTALGISRDKKALGYSSQQIDGAAVNSRPTNNFLNNLSGKIAGLDIKTNSNFGGSTNIVLRGTKSISYNNQALIVVDGVPVSNTNLNLNDAGRGRDGVDFGNSASDIDPNNIESINVLKGAAATALYGSQASNGALLITTKKGKLNKAVGVTLNTTFSVGGIDKSTFPTYQKQYGQGYGPGFIEGDVDGDGVDDAITSTGDDASYGTAFDPELMVYNWNAFALGNPNYGKATPWVAAANDPSTFFKKAFTTINSVNVNGGDEFTTYNFTYSNHYETGVMPNSRLGKNTINGNFSRQIAKGLKSTAFVTFVDQSTIGRNSVGYGDNILTGFRQWWPVNVDIKELEQEYFRNNENVTWNMVSPLEGNLAPAFWNNPYWDRYENFPTDDRTRILTGANLSWDITDDLNILGRATIDYSNSKQEIRKAVGSHSEEFGVAQSPAGETSGYWLFTNKFLQQTYDLIGTYDWKISSDFSAMLLAGGTFIKSRQEDFEASTTGGLIIPKLYTLGNSVGYFPPIQGDVSLEKSGIYAQASTDYKKTVFLEGTVRRDESTALPKDNRDYVYYSLGSSFVFSELLKNNGNADWLNFSKLRLSYAEVGNDLPPGLPGFRRNNGLIAGYPMASNSNTYVDYESLRPERQKSWEVGLEASMLDKRITIDLSLYKTNTKDLLFNVPQSTATGYAFSLVNAGETENKGIEVALGLTPVRTPDFQWNVNINWAKNKNKVIALNEGRENLQLANFQATSLNATVGQPYGSFRGIGYQFLNGQPVVNEDGVYINVQDQVLGNIQPDWLGGVYNKLSYKNFSIGFLIDVKSGGDLFHLISIMSVNWIISKYCWS